MRDIVLVVVVLPEGHGSVSRSGGQVSGPVRGDVRTEAERGDVPRVLGQDRNRRGGLQTPDTDDLVARAGGQQSAGKNIKNII